MNIRQRRAVGAIASGTGLVLALGACGGSSDSGGSAASGGPVTLTITANAIAGGKNAAEADWINSYVIPTCSAELSTSDRKVTVAFEPNGVDDEAYKTKVSLDLKSSSGADIIALDGIWIGEFAEAGYIEPLDEIAGAAVTEWDGWAQIPEAVQGSMSFDGKIYGTPQGADGRVLYYNKSLFEKAGLPTDWQPTSWADILDAARALKKIDGVNPIQVNAGTAMGEATTMQGVLPLLVGTGAQVWEDGKWLGSSDEMKEVLDFYRTVYVDEGLGDPILQQEAAGRDQSFADFADGKIGILLEGDYFWRSVINPDPAVGTAPMVDRDTVVGYTKIPALKPGAGINDQDFVSMSGGVGRVINPDTKNPDLAWGLLACMNSKAGFEARIAGAPAITPRDDVNKAVLADEPMLNYVSTEVLPITAYRPGLSAYTEVSSALQEATAAVTSGTPVDEAMADYAKTVEKIVGAENVAK